MNDSAQLGASFRDPSGFLFQRAGKLYRQINQAYAADYDRLMSSGLYEKLVKAGLLVAHEESTVSPEQPPIAYKVIEPRRLSFISYPYEWSFSMLQDAALATLSIHRRALKAGMALKDASAYNIQLLDGKPALIDTLSFESYRDGEPWVAYRQFCQHFLAPLALMAYTDVRLSQLLRVYIDGIPLDLASRLLPGRTRLNPGLLAHIHLHAGAQRRYADEAPKSARPASARISREAMLALVENLQSTVRKLQWKAGGTEWGDYYEMTNYSGAAFEHKKELIASWVARVKPASVWDLGANDGTFSRLASSRQIPTVAFDIDPTAVEKNYRKVKADQEPHLLPLVLDLTNPSPALGWHNRERESIFTRGPADMVFALALIHHLAISNNVPLRQLAEFFHQSGKWLVIEYIPKSDSQVQKLLQTRLDIFPGYSEAGFEQAFEQFFAIREKTYVRESERCLYLMECK
jgi:ribosomal protein L11 methylase PrmA